MNWSRNAAPPESRIGSDPAPATGRPSRNVPSERARIPTTTQRAFTPRLAPRVSIRPSSSRIPGSETILGSKPIPSAERSTGSSGRNASAKAISVAFYMIACER